MSSFSSDVPVSRTPQDPKLAPLADLGAGWVMTAKGLRMDMTEADYEQLANPFQHPDIGRD